MEYLIISLLLVLIIGVFYMLKKLKDTSSEGKDLQQLENDNMILQGKLDDLKEGKRNLEDDIKELRKEKEELLQVNASKSQQIISLNKDLNTQKEDIEKLQEKFKLEFENIATKIFKENTKDFSKSSKENLSQILDPLRENILKFKKSVDDRAEVDTKNHAILYEKLRQLQDINQSIGKEARNLTNALKGESKTQGNWGEFILTRILESSGLREGEEYETEVFSKTEEGQANIRPDVIIKLPENNHLIIDSKVSLKAYEQYAGIDDDIERGKYLKDHLSSVRKHIKTLYEKNYSGSKDFNSPDFVLLFMPVEPAFILATQKDPELFNYAWAKKIVIVCPSTLLATLKTIASIWKQDRQNKNAFLIAEEAGKMYDKFTLVLDSMDRIENSLNQAQSAYSEARKRIESGSGNLIGRFEKIKKLGANTSKNIDSTTFETNQIEE